jgi:hypothetical protein
MGTGKPNDEFGLKGHTKGKHAGAQSKRFQKSWNSTVVAALGLVSITLNVRRVKF